MNMDLFLILRSLSCLCSLQLSGTEILDAIDNEATGTLKECYITLGMSFLEAMFYMVANYL